jgi:hypothetical protein
MYTLPDMSKRTSYDEIYCPDVRGRCPEVCARSDGFKPVDGFLLSAPTIKKHVRADWLMRPRGRSPSTRTRRGRSKKI